MREKTLEDDDLDDQVLRRPIILQKETIMLCHLLQFPQGGVNMRKKEPQLAMMKPWNFRARTINLF